MSKKNLGTDQNLLVSNVLPTDLQSVDAIAKLNIMTEANADLNKNVPQLMLSQTTNQGNVKIWNGDRLNITYASGNQAGYFGITEITGGYRGRLNLEFIGANNLYDSVITGTFANSFIYSEGNKLANEMNNCNFFHSDYNDFQTRGSTNLNFINSNNNTFQIVENFGSVPSANGISLYNSNQNCFKVTDTNVGYSVVPSSLLQNFSLIGSNYNLFVGRTKNSTVTSNSQNTTFINTNSGFYNFNENHGSLTFIGNTFGYINNVTGGNVIGIGEGLIQDGGNSDKILLGFYNQNTTDPNEILVVGDGRLNRNYVEDFVKNTDDWTKKEDVWYNLMTSISSTGSTDSTDTHYRHNIFTVNKNGYITISDYRNPSNSARYGYNGITGYVDGKIYTLPFESIFTKLEADNANELRQEYIDSLAEGISKKVDELPVMKFESFTDPKFVLDNDNVIQTTAYLNLEKSTNEAAIYAITDLDTYTNNSVFTVSYQPDTLGHPERNIPAKLIWSYYEPVESGKRKRITASTLIYPYCSKQFILRKPADKGELDDQPKPFSGITIVDGDDNTSVTYEGWETTDPTYFITRWSRDGVENKVYYSKGTPEWVPFNDNGEYTFDEFVTDTLSSFNDWTDASITWSTLTAQDIPNADSYHIEYIEP